MHIVTIIGIPITESIVQTHFVDTEFETKIGNFVQFVQMSLIKSNLNDLYNPNSENIFLIYSVMKIKLYEDFEWDEDDINKNFEYVKTSNFMHNSNIYISLKEIKNDGEVGEQLKLFKDKWTNGWNIKSFIPLTNNEMDIIKNKNMKIGFFDGYKWKSLSYNKFIKKYPQFEI